MEKRKRLFGLTGFSGMYCNYDKSKISTNSSLLRYASGFYFLASSQGVSGLFPASDSKASAHMTMSTMLTILS